MTVSSAHLSGAFYGRPSIGNMRKTDGSIRPAKVYLDNSDLSRLYNAKANGLGQLRYAILARADDGRATFWYSYWHIFEFLQPAEGKYIKDRREGAAFLKRLCGTKTLPYFLTFWRRGMQPTDYGCLRSCSIVLPQLFARSSTARWKVEGN